MKSTLMKRFCVINLAIILLFGINQIQAQTVRTVKTSSSKDNISKTQKVAIENIVREYLLKNPSVIRDAMQALEIKEAKEKLELAAKNLKTYEKEIFADPNSPTAGNEKAEVSIVAFFDYNCGYCKSSLPMLKELLATDPSIRVVFKEYPILSQSSQLAAKAALAAHRQGKYAEFHEAFVGDQEIDDEFIKSISDKFGVNYETLIKDMNDESINENLANNYKLANDLNIQGTPAYIVGTQVIPGAIDLNSLMIIIEAEREKISKATNAAKVAIGK